jgi:transcriptional regulator with XRE-family HTH domain
MPKVKLEFDVPGELLRKAREQYQKGHLLDPDKRDRISEKIAEGIKVKRETLYKMERDQYTMTYEQLLKLEQIYGVSLYAITLNADKTITVEENNEYRNL